MTRAETHKIVKNALTKANLRDRDATTRELKAAFIIGQIHHCRSLSKLCRSGNEKAVLFAEICDAREASLLLFLRKL